MAARRAVDVEDDGRGELRAAVELQHWPQRLRQLRLRPRDVDRCVITASAGVPSGPAVGAVVSFAHGEAAARRRRGRRQWWRNNCGDDGDGGSSGGGGGGGIDAGIDEEHRRGHPSRLGGLGGSVGGPESGGERVRPL